MTDLEQAAAEELSDSILNKPLTFSEHKELTAGDLETVAGEFMRAAKAAREGNMREVERLIFQDEDRRESARINVLMELVGLRYSVRQERIERTSNPVDPVDPRGEDDRGD